MHSPLKLLGLRLILVLMSIGFFFGCGEITLRVLYAKYEAEGGNLEERLRQSQRRDLGEQGGEYNMSGLVQPSLFSNIVYELKPNLSGRFRDKTFRSSSLGIRDKEYSMEKPKQTYRIMGIGDSVMFGWGVHQGEAYLDLLEDRLNALEGDPRTFETFNFALPGYNTTMEVATLEHRAMAYQPDLIIIQFVNNDLGVPLFMQRPKDPATMRKSYFYEFLKTRIGWIQADRNPLIGNQLKGLEDAERAKTLKRYAHMVGPSGYRNATDRLGALAKEKECPVILLLGSASPDQQKLIDDVVAKHGFHPLRIKPYSDAWVKQEGIENTKAARRKALWVSDTDHHPNQHGHRIYADGLMHKLLEMGIIDYHPDQMPWVRPDEPASQPPPRPLS